MKMMHKDGYMHLEGWLSKYYDWVYFRWWDFQ